MVADLRGVMRVVKCALLAGAIVVGSLMPALGQTPPNGPISPVVTRTQPIMPFRLVRHGLDRLRGDFADDWYRDTRARADNE